MAEGLAHSLISDLVTPYSAGIVAQGLNPNAVKVMAERNIDITSQTSNTVNQLPTQDFDFVITVCSNAHETCPTFPAKTAIIHAPFEDPPALAANESDPEKALDHYRRVRDQIEAYILKLPATLIAQTSN
ncbi:Protein ArsC [Poriferisphaera corsica]|uniref:Protein ArsC n=2 Tax=Poriferisphaera corsica TaxID=2528020 RepID=A0A517YT18_9BACT|nr:Protein ArsC [Poriferisphaera corsica]